MYKRLASLLVNDKKFLKITQKNLTDNDIYHLKESIYNLDFRLAQSFYTTLIAKGINLRQYYSDQVILGICANCRETFLGLMLFVAYLSAEEKKTKKDLKIHLIKRIYITDMLNINIEKADKGAMIKILDSIYDQFAEILKNRIEIDDNKDFLRISTENRISFIETSKTKARKIMDDEEIIKKITGEDIIRFR